jgi:hypothetical protein
MSISITNQGNSETWDFNKNSIILAYNSDTRQTGIVTDLVISWEDN